ncbi:MAG TPA: SAM-dependent methyltransferase, partial [Acetobacteraceae bacterium]
MDNSATLDVSAGAALIRLAQAIRDTGYSFVTPTPATIARVNARPGAEWAADLRGVFGWSRPFRDDVLPTVILRAMQDAAVLADHPGGGHRSLVRLSTLGGELFLHSAYPTAAADAVFFGPDTY